MKKSLLIFLALCTATAFGSWKLNTKDVNIPSSFENTWSIIILPDTQYYSDVYPGLFDLQTTWIKNNAHNINAKYVILNGDITNGNKEREWKNASESLAILDRNIPYAMCPGNHDSGLNGWAGDRTTLMDKYFPFERLAGWSGIAGVKTKGEIRNSYHFFTAGDNSKWMIICLEWSPTDNTLAWADKVLKEFSNKKTIIVTHAYTYYDSTRYDWNAKKGTQEWNPLSYKTKDGNDGQGIWEKLIKSNPNVSLVISGHVLGDGTGVIISRNDSDDDVIQMLVNFQPPIKDIGGQAWLRVLTFNNDMKKISCWTYSPLYKNYLRDEDQLFEFIKTDD